MKKMLVLLLLVMCLSLAACGGNKDYEVVKTEENTLEDSSVITHGYNKDGILISEIAAMADGNIHEHRYDLEGKHIFESATLADGSYHEFQYDKNGNVVKEIHK